jgi:phospholipid-translocating ATPase
MKDCLSRNSMIAEDLGRIEYFLTDKTGTLTKNEMIMKKLNIVSRTLDTSKIEDMTSLGISSSNKKELKFLLPDDKNDDTHFFRAVAVLLTCHAVFPKLDKFGFKVLDSTSPDELSFIEFCEKIGFKLLKRTDHLVSFSTPDKREFEFKILRIFPFTSARQRMGVILEWNNTILYFLKGADSKMIPTLKKIYKEKTAEETAQLSAQGLRTLVIS